MKIDKEKLSKYFLIELPGDHKLSELINWKVLGCKSIEKTYTALTQTIDFIVLQTNESAWVEEFKICILNDSKDKDFLIMVSPECPEVYFSMPEDILDKIEDILLTSINSEGNKLFEELKILTEEINKYNGYGSIAINKDQLTTNPIQWGRGSYITCSSGDANSPSTWTTTTSSCSNVGPLTANDINIL